MQRGRSRWPLSVSESYKALSARVEGTYHRRRMDCSEVNQQYHSHDILRSLIAGLRSINDPLKHVILREQSSNQP